MTEQVQMELESVRLALTEELLVMGYDSVNHRGVISVVRQLETGEVEYVPIAEVSLVHVGPAGVH